MAGTAGMISGRGVGSGQATLVDCSDTWMKELTAMPPATPILIDTAIIIILRNMVRSPVLLHRLFTECRRDYWLVQLAKGWS